MYKNTLVPIVFDHDPSAERALEIAYKLLKQDGKVTLLHVVEEMPGYVSAQLPKDMLKNTVAEAEVKLTEIGQRLAKDASVVVTLGHPSRTILEQAESIGADCIVLAGHKPGFEDYLLGSTASRVVRHAKCSVHILR